MFVSAGSKTLGRRALTVTKGAAGVVPCLTTLSAHTSTLAEPCFYPAHDAVRVRRLSSQHQPSASKQSLRSRTIGSRERKHVELQTIRAELNDILDRLTSGNAVINHDQATVIAQQVHNVMDSLASAVESGDLNPSGKHGKEISTSIERILRAYHHLSQVISTDSNGIPCFQYCKRAFDALKTWNLNRQHSHYDHYIAVANKEERWKEATDVFYQQIDPGAAYNPVRVSIADPQGLYAVARLAQEAKSSVADLVFDAVMQLSMVSPQDQSTYILAAGTALGKTGEWEAALEFIDNSYAFNQLGQTLVSSVMQACLLSGKPDAALSVFEAKVAGVDHKKLANEWQWGGNPHTIDPLMRDLVMRASWGRQEGSSSALQFFHDSVAEGLTISDDALLGVLRACERDGNVEGCLSVLDCILQNASRDNWIVPGLELNICECETDDAARLSNGTTAYRWLPTMSQQLACALRTFNAVSNFGTGMFYLTRLHMAMDASNSAHSTSMVQDAVSPRTMVNFLSNTLSSFHSHDELIGPTVAALCGLRCYDDAAQLLDRLHQFASTEEQATKIALLREYVRTESAKNGNTIIGNSWTNADRHIQRLTYALQIIRETNYKVTVTERNQLLKCLAVAMQACTSAHQADLSLRLSSFVANDLQRNRSTNDNLLRSRESSWSGLLTVNDALTAEIIHSLVWNNRLLEAVEIFQSVLAQESSRLGKWRSTCSAGLLVLIKIGRGQEAFELFQAMDTNIFSPSCFSAIGRHLLTTNNTEKLTSFYKLALDSGRLSDDLTLLTMRAVAESKIDNRVRVLRTIVDDNAKYVGTSREKWMEARYWNIKRELGFSRARLLMWWNDPETCHLDELDFALSEFYLRCGTNLKVRNDVLRVLVNNARSFDLSSMLPDDTVRWKHIPRTRESWTELLEQIVEECESSPISYDADFIDSVVAAFRNVDANDQCVKYITKIIDRPVDLHRSTLTEALKASTVQHAMGLASDIRMLMAEHVN